MIINLHWPSGLALDFITLLLVFGIMALIVNWFMDLRARRAQRRRLKAHLDAVMAGKRDRP